MLKLLAFVLPMALDSFAVAAAIGAARVTTASQRLRISLIFVLFEGGMPLIGLGLGTALAHGIGVVAGYIAAIVVIGIGSWMLFSDDKDEEAMARRITTSRGLALIGLGIGVSADELAIGFSFGLTRLAVITVITAIAAICFQAFAATQIGLAAGARIAGRWRERTERLAGFALLVLGVYLFAGQLTR